MLIRPGNPSGSSLLRSISDLIPKNPRSRGNHEQSSPTETNSIGSPSMSVNLADAATINGLIDAYFTWYNPSYPVLHERTFRQECQNRQQIHPRSNWHPIFFLVLAIGHWTLTEEAEQSNYYTAARSRMSMRMLESGTLLAVQAFLLMVCLRNQRSCDPLPIVLIGIRVIIFRSGTDLTQGITSLASPIEWRLVWAFIVNLLRGQLIPTHC